MKSNCPACGANEWGLYHASVCGYWHAAPPLTETEKATLRAGGKIRECAAAEVLRTAYGQGWRRRARCI